MGRKSKYKQEYATQAFKIASLGATDYEMAIFFEISLETLNQWRIRHKKFSDAVYAGKDAPDQRVVRSLYQRAVGYSYDAVKIFMPANADDPVVVPYTEHVPPDPGAAKNWLCNRLPEQWRDKQTHEHTGKDGGPIRSDVNVTYNVVKAQKYEDDGVVV